MKKTMINKGIALLLILTICMFSLSGCYNIQDIDKLAYVVALGFDVGDTNNLKMSFQISTPSGSSESGGSSQSSETIVNSVECATINSGINLIDSYMSKQINLSHCKVLVFSEKLAEKGLSKYIYTLVNNIQIRPDSNVIVSKCDARYFLDNSKPTLERLSSRYYEIAPTSSEYTGYTADIQLGYFFSCMNDTFTDPSAILGAINTPSTHDTNSNQDNPTKDSSYVAGETTLDTESNIENMGLAVFKGDTLVGELNGIETICHLLVTGRLENCIITIPSPFSNTDTISLDLRLKGKPQNIVDFVNGSPLIKTKVKVTARILSINKLTNNLNDDNINKIEEYANSYLEENISEYLYKTAKIYKADIAGLGKHAVSKFLFWNDWTSYNWLDNYCNSVFQVEVDTNVISSYVILGT